MLMVGRKERVGMKTTNRTTQEDKGSNQITWRVEKKDQRASQGYGGERGREGGKCDDGRRAIKGQNCCKTDRHTLGDGQNRTDPPPTKKPSLTIFDVPAP